MKKYKIVVDTKVSISYIIYMGVLRWSFAIRVRQIKQRTRIILDNVELMYDQMQ